MNWGVNGASSRSPHVRGLKIGKRSRSHVLQATAFLTVNTMSALGFHVTYFQHNQTQALHSELPKPPD